MLQNFRTYQLSVEFYRAGQKIRMPKYLKDQFDRASSSICLNLAEGSGKRTPKDQRRFYDISLGSLRECQAILELIGNQSLTALADHLAASTYRLCQSTS
jgi:four helix bundle protein